MGRNNRQRLVKVIKYIEEDNVSKLKQYVRKHSLTLPEFFIESHRDGTLLHLAARLGHDSVMRYLLKKGVDASLCDKDGNLPLHLAIKNAALGNDFAYTDLVLPLLKSYPDGIDSKNNKGESPRVLLERFREWYRKEHLTEHQEEKRGGTASEDDTFRQKLTSEMENEYYGDWGKYEQDFGYQDHNEESFKDWSERINREKQQKAQKRMIDQDSKGKHKRRKEEEDLRKKDFQRKLEEEHEQYLEKSRQKEKEKLLKILLEQKRDYEHRWIETFGETSCTENLSYKQIPFPARGEIKNILEILFCDIDKEKFEKEYKQYLREQQIRWHPDKFSQKCGSRLKEQDANKIINRVKEISQALNQLADELK